MKYSSCILNTPNDAANSDSDSRRITLLCLPAATAAFINPRLKLFSSRCFIKKRLAPPVTDMIILGSSSCHRLVMSFHASPTAGSIVTVGVDKPLSGCVCVSAGSLFASPSNFSLFNIRNCDKRQNNDVNAQWLSYGCLHVFKAVKFSVKMKGNKLQFLPTRDVQDKPD